MQKDLAEVFDDPKFEHALWGVHVEDAATGEVVYARNNEKFVIPASNMKLFVGAAMFETFGAEFQFATEIHATGPIRDGVLNGSLIVRGGGDPSIGGRFHKNDRLYIFRQWAAELKKKGIEKIDGNIIGDDDLFEDAPYGKGWQWDDLPYWYAAKVSALSFNDNCIDLLIEPGRSVGAPAVIKASPKTDYVTIDNQTVTLKRRPRSDRELKELVYRPSPDGRSITVKGPVLTRQKRFQDWAAISNPTLYTVSVFREVLIQQGIEVTGDAVDIDDIKKPLKEESRQLVVEWKSPPLSKLLRVLLNNSQNLYGEMFLRYLGAKDSGYGTAKAGARAIADRMKKLGVPDGEYLVADGSGLSRENLVTPRAVCALLKAMLTSPHSETFLNSLPVAGERGSLSGRMRKAPTVGNVRAKTGSINGVRALSGYVESGDRDLFVFSFIVNNYQTSGTSPTRLQDRACALIVGFKQ